MPERGVGSGTTHKQAEPEGRLARGESGRAVACARSARAGGGGTVAGSVRSASA